MSKTRTKDKSNPYTLTFGKEPKEHIDRPVEKREILDEFLSPDPSRQVFIITAARGCGKTVFMTDVASEISAGKDWVVADLNPNSADILGDACAILGSDNELASVFRAAKINLSLLGFGIEIPGSVPIASTQVALERMVKSLSNKKRILFTIDEATGSSQMKLFAAAFQQLVRRNLPVYLLMTGLYENISDLQNQDTLTFLYRAPKVKLLPLDERAMAESYKKRIGLASDDAGEMARLTMGYSFAFQVLGHLLWEADGDYTGLIDTFRRTLDEQSYSKIWSELSGRDKDMAYALALSDGSNHDIMRRMGMKQNEYAPYRDRLIKKGVAMSPERGRLCFALPFFREFVMEMR